MIYQAPYRPKRRADAPAAPEPTGARWGLGTWALVLACVMCPPLGLVALAVYWWRREE